MGIEALIEGAGAGIAGPIGSQARGGARQSPGRRGRTGISSLKVRFKKVFGYYIEVTESNLGAVPDREIGLSREKPFLPVPFLPQLHCGERQKRQGTPPLAHLRQDLRHERFVFEPISRGSGRLRERPTES
ncbi:MAG TPA: hypothetical protein VLK65_22555 [Vicinamibacteria bacterium]|nr:hypothetical protein [Vicinamibacteria bacterium]